MGLATTVYVLAQSAPSAPPSSYVNSETPTNDDAALARGAGRNQGAPDSLADAGQRDKEDVPAQAWDKSKAFSDPSSILPPYKPAQAADAADADREKAEAESDAHEQAEAESDAIFWASASRPPKFDQFYSPVYRGPIGRLNLIFPDAYAFQTRLGFGSRQPVNFAGHYQLVEWGCGTSCLTGAIIDALTGHVTFLPIVNSGNIKQREFNAIEFHVGSRLIVLSGQLDQAGVTGTHFDLWNGSGFQDVLIVPSKLAAKEPPSEPAATPLVSAVRVISRPSHAIE